MKKFNCQVLPNDYIEIDHSTKSKGVIIETYFYSGNHSITISLSKPDAIEFCREIMKQISLLE